MSRKRRPVGIDKRSRRRRRQGSRLFRREKLREIAFRGYDAKKTERLRSAIDELMRLQRPDVHYVVLTYFPYRLSYDRLPDALADDYVMLVLVLLQARYRARRHLKIANFKLRPRNRDVRLAPADKRVPHHIGGRI